MIGTGAGVGVGVSALVILKINKYISENVIIVEKNLFF